MEILGFFLNGKLDEISASVTLGVLAVDSGSGVKWLMNVSNIVDQ